MTSSWQTHGNPMANPWPRNAPSARLAGPAPATTNRCRRSCHISADPEALVVRKTHTKKAATRGGASAPAARSARHKALVSTQIGPRKPLRQCQASFAYGVSPLTRGAGGARCVGGLGIAPWSARRHIGVCRIGLSAGVRSSCENARCCPNTCVSRCWSSSSGANSQERIDKWRALATPPPTIPQRAPSSPSPRATA